GRTPRAAPRPVRPPGCAPVPHRPRCPAALTLAPARTSARSRSQSMITATGIELRAGARILIESATFRIAPGDRIGLVGRNGAGKTTLTKCLAGESIPAAGTITRSGEVGYLPQDPRTGDLDVLARDRILSARGLDT